MTYLHNIMYTGNMLRLNLYQLPDFRAQNGVVSICSKDSEVTGDSYEIFYNKQGCALYFCPTVWEVERASVDSLLASRMIGKMIKAGIDQASAIKYVNSTLVCRDWEESFATVDISTINLYDKTLEIIKAGGYATYIYREAILKKVEVISYPIEFSQKSHPKQKISLKSNDIIITATDGFCENSKNEIVKLMHKNKELPPQEIAQKLAEYSCTVAGDKYDDVTIAVTKFLQISN